ncbi:MAG: nucleoside hydrolase [Bacteroidota bacterium]
MMIKENNFKIGTRTKRMVLLSLLLALNAFHTVIWAQTQKEEGIPVIYSSDLWDPHGDPDDHFDLATLFSIKNLDIRAVIIDYTMQANVKRTKVEKEPNLEVVEKVTRLFDRKAVSVEAGLQSPLQSTKDKGLDYPQAEQKAIALIMRQLKEVPDKSAFIITTGSVRDICAAFNRNPRLFHEKVKKVIISVGDSFGYAGIEDTNTAKDVEAWKCLMTSGLPIDWMPTNPSKRRGGPSRFVSYWLFFQPRLLQQSPEKIRQFFASERIRSDHKTMRPMWSTPAFIESAGLQCYQIDDELGWMSPTEAQDRPKAKMVAPYSFVPIEFSLDDEGVAVWKEAGEGMGTNIRVFRINDYYLYNESMFQFLVQQFK